MATFKEFFGPATLVTPTSLGALPNNGQWTMPAVDNTTTLYLDAQVTVTVTTGATAPAANQVVAVYAYGSMDSGTTYPDNVTGAESTTALTNLGNVRQIGLVNVQAAANATTKAGPFSVAQAFGGTLPTRWGIIIVNTSGQTLAAGNSAATNFVTWTGVQVQSV